MSSGPGRYLCVPQNCLWGQGGTGVAISQHTPGRGRCWKGSNLMGNHAWLSCPVCRAMSRVRILDAMCTGLSNPTLGRQSGIWFLHCSCVTTMCGRWCGLEHLLEWRARWLCTPQKPQGLMFPLSVDRCPHVGWSA